MTARSTRQATAAAAAPAGEASGAAHTGYRPGQVLQLDWAELPTRPRIGGREPRVYALIGPAPACMPTAPRPPEGASPSGDLSRTSSRSAAASPISRHRLHLRPLHALRTSFALLTQPVDQPRSNSYAVITLAAVFGRPRAVLSI
jgi:hypothetical protein